MAVPLNNERRTSEFSAGSPRGMVLPWLMTMPSPNEAMNIGRRPDEKRAAESNSVPEGPPEGRSGATQLMPIPDAPPSAAAPAFPTRGATDSSCCPTPLPGDHSGDARPAETYALTRPLRTAEHEGRNSHATPESSAENLRESSSACATEITPLPGLQLKEEVPNIELGPHPAETYVAPEADVAIGAEHERWNSLAAPECAREKSEGVSGGTNELGLSPRANYLMPDNEIASVAQANQLERDWIRAVSDVPTADSFEGGVAEFKQSDLATQGSKTGTRIILVASIFTASVLCIWTSGLKPFPDLPHGAEMASPAASVSSKPGLGGTRTPEVDNSSGRSETSSSQPVLSSQPQNSFGADARMTPISPAPARPEVDRESIPQLQPDRQDVQPPRITDTPHVAILPLPPKGITVESRVPEITNSTCFASASEVRQEHPESWPSWTLRALGHEGAKCWYPTTRTLAHDHRK